eukprot:6136111-Alexandrium_andersonii.AAC.1
MAKDDDALSGTQRNHVLEHRGAMNSKRMLLKHVHVCKYRKAVDKGTFKLFIAASPGDQTQNAAHAVTSAMETKGAQSK